MNITKAILEAQRTGRWFRPFGYRGSGVALYVVNGVVGTLTPYGYEPGLPPRAEVLVDEWEMVLPDTVLSERNSA